MAFFNYPGTIDKNTKAVAAEVQTNFDTLLAWVLANLVQKDGTVAMTAPLVLAPGAPASPDQAANKAYVDAVMPVGVIQAYAGTSLPTGWLWCNGDTYTNTAKPALSAAIGRAYTAAATPAGSFQVPDLSRRFPAGRDYDGADAAFALGKQDAGQRDSELRAHSHIIPAHGHGSQISGSTNGGGGVDHLHHPGGYSADGGGHGHVSNGGHSEVLFRDSAYNTGYGIPQSGAGLAVTWGPLAAGEHHHGLTSTSGAADRSLDHNHTLTLGVAVNDKPAFNTQDGGAGTTLIDKNLPPYTVVNYIIYAGA
jgi:microcystin-dependent protein